MAKTFTSYLIEDRSFLAYIKRTLHQEVAQLDFSPQKVGEIDIIISEITSNIIKHAGTGELLCRSCKESDGDPVFEIIAIDKGPGMADTARMMKDGVSTKDTLGGGLGAIQRLSSAFHLYSIPSWGTVLYAKVQSKKAAFVRKNDLDIEIRPLCVNKAREEVCGDGYRIKRTASEVKIFFGDGLGHGENAKEAVDVAGNFFLECEESDPVQIIRGMHEKIRRTRGLVGTVAIFDKKEKKWRICGVGNIMGRMYHGIVYKNYMSYNGTIGLNIPTSMKVSEYAAERNQMLILCSDGIRTRWDLSRYSSVQRFDPFVLASCIHKDFTRGNDDSSVLIAKVI